MATPGDLVVEDGTGLDNSNVYALIPAADTYHSLFSNDAWNEAIDNDKATALVSATQYLDLRWEFVGEIANPGDPATNGQALEWPRTNGGSNLFDAKGNEIGDTELPQQIIDAMFEYALVFLGSGRLLPDPTIPDTAGRFVNVKREKLGPLEEETRYSDTRGTRTLQKYAQADRIIRESGLAINTRSDRASRA